MTEVSLQSSGQRIDFPIRGTGTLGYQNGEKIAQTIPPKKPICETKANKAGNSLAVQWLGLRALTAEGAGSIPSQGAKIPQAVQGGQKRTKN